MARIVACRVCGEGFQPGRHSGRFGTNSTARRVHAKYCTRACQQSAYRARRAFGVAPSALKLPPSPPDTISRHTPRSAHRPRRQVARHVSDTFAGWPHGHGEPRSRKGRLRGCFRWFRAPQTGAAASRAVSIEKSDRAHEGWRDWPVALRRTHHEAGCLAKENAEPRCCAYPAKGSKL